VLQRQYLSPIAQRILRQQPYLRQAVEHDADWRDLAHAIEDQLGGLAELHFGGMEQCQLPLGIEARFGGDELED